MITGLSVVILAAGSGTRMASNCPKVLHCLADQPLLQHVIHAVKPLKPAEIFVLYGHQGELVLKALEKEKELTWIEQKQRLGTGHAALQVLPFLKDGRQVLILCGDTPLITTETLRSLIAQTSPEAVGLITTHLSNPFGLGRILRDTSGHISGIVEEKDASETQKKMTEINAGIYCFPASFLHQNLPLLENKNHQKEFYLTDLIALACKEGRAIQSVSPQKKAEVCGVNTRTQLSRLERIYQKWQAQELMQAGVSLMDPKRIDIRGVVIPAKDCVIDINVILKGQVILAEGCFIGAHCILENVSLAPGAIVHPHSIIQEAEIGENCIIGPFARIRPNTQLGKNVHIGNFVEVKNTQIDEGSKANHLSYIGDAKVGKNVNIGAGVITCNYNGADKFITRIEDDVFVGSDVQLIAPITLHQGATIGAGTTLVKDAPAGKLSLSRSKQNTIEGWVRPTKNKKKD